MGIFGKIKNVLGIGGVKVGLEGIPGQIQKGQKTVAGRAVLRAKSEQTVLEVKVTMVEEYSTGRGEEKRTEEFELGRVDLVRAPFHLRAEESKSFDFQLPYSTIKSSNDQLKEKGGALGALGKMGSFATAEKSHYFIKAEADVKGTVLDPSDKKGIKLV